MNIDIKCFKAKFRSNFVNYLTLLMVSENTDELIVGHSERKEKECASPWNTPNDLTS